MRVRVRVRVRLRLRLKVLPHHHIPGGLHRQLGSPLTTAFAAALTLFKRAGVCTGSFDALMFGSCGRMGADML